MDGDLSGDLSNPDSLCINAQLGTACSACSGYLLATGHRDARPGQHLRDENFNRPTCLQLATVEG